MLQLECVQYGEALEFAIHTIYYTDLYSICSKMLSPPLKNKTLLGVDYVQLPPASYTTGTKLRSCVYLQVDFPGLCVAKSF